MTDLNTNFFAYSCPTCSGRLVKDDIKKICYCVSCGNAYDYDYYLGLNLMEEATSSLESGEYNSAKKMFEYLIEKEPDNFKANVGMLFSDCEIKNIDSMDEEDFIRTSSTIKTDEYRNRCGKSAEEFFDNFDKANKAGTAIKLNNSKLEAIDSKARSHENRIKDIGNEYQSLYVRLDGRMGEGDIHPATRLKYSGIAIAVLAVICVLIALAIDGFDAENLMVIFGIPLVSILLFFASNLIALPNFFKMRRLDEEIKKETELINEIKLPVSEITENNRVLKSEIFKSIKAMKKCYNEI